MPPIRIVSIGGKTIAVRDEETHAVGIAVPAHANPGAVLERDFESRARRRNFKLHRRSPPAYFSRRLRVGRQGIRARLWRRWLARSTLDSRRKSGLCVLEGGDGGPPVVRF